MSAFQRYEATILQRLFRIMRELEKLQRMRKGERLPAPAALNVSVHQETGMESGTVPLPREVTLGDEEDTAIERVTLPEPDRNPG